MVLITVKLIVVLKILAKFILKLLHKMYLVYIQGRIQKISEEVADRQGSGDYDQKTVFRAYSRRQNSSLFVSTEKKLKKKFYEGVAIAYRWIRHCLHVARGINSNTSAHCNCHMNSAISHGYESHPRFMSTHFNPEGHNRTMWNSNQYAYPNLSMANVFQHPYIPRQMSDNDMRTCIQY